MATLKVSASLVEELLFGYTPNPVEIVGVIYDSATCTIIFDVVGNDVPDAEAIVAVCTQRANRAGQRLIEMKFEPA